MNKNGFSTRILNQFTFLNWIFDFSHLRKKNNLLLNIIPIITGLSTTLSIYYLQHFCKYKIILTLWIFLKIIFLTCSKDNHKKTSNFHSYLGAQLRTKIMLQIYLFLQQNNFLSRTSFSLKEHAFNKVVSFLFLHLFFSLSLLCVHIFFFSSLLSCICVHLIKIPRKKHRLIFFSFYVIVLCVQHFLY